MFPFSVHYMEILAAVTNPSSVTRGIGAWELEESSFVSENQ